MNILLDTHILLWWLDDSPVLSDLARRSISNGSNLIFVSAAVIWEIRIKESLGKLDIPPDFREVLENQPFEFLTITVEHAHAVSSLPSIHRDPFDRMLIAQAKTEGFTILTRDKLFREYKVALIQA
ncbi:MAG: type II toxin-antitoxin system VapC family toxin [Desulfobacterales bacterium]